ncbi:MAG: methyltransferase domain-containing protein [Candidatus Bathyarchaeia archaeon]
MDLPRDTDQNEWAEKRRIRERYQVSADAYDATYELEQAEKHKAALRVALPGKGRVILDIGCGSGRLLELLAPEVGLAVGADISVRLLSLAARRTRARRNVALVCCDVEYLPFVAGIFQMIFAVTVLQNLPSPQRALREAMRVVSPDGRLLITFLKKSFQTRDVRELLSSTGLHLEMALDNPELRDLIVLCRPVQRS